MSKMSFYFEKYKQAREELMTKIGRHVLNQTEVESLKEFKEKFDTIYSTYIMEKAKKHSDYMNKVKSLENTIEVQKVEIEKRDVRIVDLENQNKEMETLKKSLEEKNKKIEEILQKIGSLEKQDEIKVSNGNIQL